VIDFITRLMMTAVKVSDEDPHGVATVLQSIVSSYDIYTKEEAKRVATPDNLPPVIVDEDEGGSVLLVENKVLQLRMKAMYSRATPKQITRMLAIYGISKRRIRLGKTLGYYYVFPEDVVHRFLNKSISEILAERVPVGFEQVEEILDRLEKEKEGGTDDN
jgi:hypothetical protein